MEELIKILGIVTLFFLLGVLYATLTALPVMWLVNYLFTPSLLLSIFGVAKFGFWHAWFLALLCSFLFKTTSTKSKD